ncbi:HNH nuclease family protein [Escherichia coli]|nr:HNH nuclease family protein [Escherichia coli]
MEIAKIPASWETARNPTFHPGNFSWLSSQKNYARLESGYREKALKIYPWVCGRCSREFVYSNLRELTVHHIDHDHTNNPEDGSNWELLCLYCHDHEHSKYTEADQYGTTIIAGEDAQKDVGEAKYNPFADLKAMMNKKK